MVHVTLSDFNAIKAKIAKASARKAARAEKRKGLPWGWSHPKPPRILKRSRPPQRTGKIAQVSGRGALKAQIVRLLGLLDMKRQGPRYRLDTRCPAFAKIGAHNGTLGYHLIPQKRGDAARFLPENVVWACSAANWGEVNNRDLYRQHHVALFGRSLIERIEAVSRTSRQFSTAELQELRAEIKAELERP